MPDHPRFSREWLKDESAKALVNLVMIAIVGLIGYGVLQSFIGDTKIDKAVEGLRQEMVNRHNETVAREADLLHKITVLEQELKSKAPQPLPSPPAFSPLFQPDNMVTVPTMPTIPNSVNPAQVQLDFQKLHTEKYTPNSK